MSGFKHYTKKQEKKILDHVSLFMGQGLGLESIVDKLNNTQGLGTASGREWSKGNLYSFLCTRNGKVIKLLSSKRATPITRTKHVEKQDTVLAFIQNVITDPTLNDVKKINVITAYIS